jgi:hypothetical protein
MSNTKQHYVPQFYLRQWADGDEKIWMYGVNGKAPVRISIDEVAFERGLYSHPHVDGIPPLTTEKKLADLESIYAPSWPKMVDRAGNIRTRKNVARFIALMDARNPRRKKLLTNTVAYFQKKADQMKPDEKIEIVGQSKTVLLRPAEIKETFNAENTQSAFVNLMSEQAELISEILANRRWGIIFSDTPAFATSDSPVVLYRGTCTEASFGFATPGTMIFFPVSPTRMILIDDSLQLDFGLYTTANPDAFNKIIAGAAVRFVYADKESNDFSQKIRSWRTAV